MVYKYYPQEKLYGKGINITQDVYKYPKILVY